MFYALNLGFEELKTLVNDVTKIINFIRLRALLHCEFCTFLADFNLEYKEILM